MSEDNHHVGNSTIGSKRPLDHDEAEQQPSFVISQESATAADPSKRLRMSDPESPGVVSISSGMERSTHTLSDHCGAVLDMIETKSHEWWKQKPAPLPAEKSCQASSCFICRRPRLQEHQHERMPSNSLLSYFPTKASSPTTPMSMDTTPAIESFHSCSFCDRQACASCTRQCEGCHEGFCSLCSTMDYSGRTERSFCLDCHAMRGKNSDNAMHIG